MGVVTGATGVWLPLWLQPLHDANALHNQLDRTRWVLHGLHHRDVGWVQGVQGSECSLKCGHSLSQVTLAFILQRTGAKRTGDQCLCTVQGRKLLCDQVPLNSRASPLGVLLLKA